jgi:hypothetical protein
MTLASYDARSVSLHHHPGLARPLATNDFPSYNVSHDPTRRMRDATNHVCGFGLASCDSVSLVRVFPCGRMDWGKIGTCDCVLLRATACHCVGGVRGSRNHVFGFGFEDVGGGRAAPNLAHGEEGI